MIVIPLPYGGIRLEPDTNWGVGAGEVPSALLVDPDNPNAIGAIVVIDGIPQTVMRDEGHPTPAG